MSKLNILKNIQELSFSSDLSQIFSILEENLDRVEFTKDYVGLRDFLYIVEGDAVESEFPFFACIDFNESYEFEDDGVYNEVVYDISEICKQLNRFFKKFNRPLYVSIGFKESILSSDDMIYICTMIENNKIKDKMEGELQLRKFPNWYTAKYPNEILEDEEFKDLLESLKIKEYQMTQALKEQILNQIDEALDVGNRDLFFSLTAKLKKMDK